MKLLSRSEEMLLLSIWRLQENAYGVTIRKQLIEVTGKTWSFGALHVTLDRLAKKRLIDSKLSEPENKRGGRSKRIYSLRPAGLEALVEIRKIEEAMWSGIDSLDIVTT
jgi:PadR family transcriptional regulator